MLAFNCWLISCKEWVWWSVVVLKRDKEEEDLVLAMVAGKQALIPIVKFLANQEEFRGKTVTSRATNLLS